MFADSCKIFAAFPLLLANWVSCLSDERTQLATVEYVLLTVRLYSLRQGGC